MLKCRPRTPRTNPNPSPSPSPSPSPNPNPNPNPNLTLTEVQAAHAAYVAALRALFDAHKTDFGYGDRQLVVG